MPMSIKVDGVKPIERTVASIRGAWNKEVIFELGAPPASDYVDYYEALIHKLGKVRKCNSANDPSSPFGISRDIRPLPGERHFFCSSTRQPLHNDTAYYPAEDAPEWLLLYCLKPSELGGITSVISVRTLMHILSKYAPELLSQLATSVTWRFRSEELTITHEKPILHDGRINWNFWQITSELNADETMDIAAEFFDFLEQKIVGGEIYDLSKKWLPGEAILINDHKTLHARSAFFGDRWLKDHVFFARSSGGSASD